MTVRAVVFDLFGTLVTYPPGARHVHAMASAVGVRPEDLRPLWRGLRPQRDAGAISTVEALRRCSVELGVQHDEERLADACAAVEAFFRDILVPRAGALEALEALRSRGMRIGLLSDANLEVSRLWSETALAPLVDTAVFSCDEHVRKPDPRLYRVVCERLGVGAGDCLYVGNGDGDELAGALAAGMRAVLFAAPGEYPGREAATWTGQRIAELSEVLAHADTTALRA